MLGEMAVGKSSIVRRMVLGRFDGNYKGTMGHDIFVHNLSGLGPARDQAMTLVIWDTDGGLGTSAFRQDSATKGAAAAIIVGDVTRPRTLVTMAELARECDIYLPGRHVHFLLNKIDLLAEPTDVELPDELVASPHPLLMTSAKTDENIKVAFMDVANAILRRGF
jgi:Ras-related protein Rab-5C